MTKQDIAGAFCGVFAIVALGAAAWWVSETLWGSRDLIWQMIKEHPVASVFWTAAAGFFTSFIIGTAP